MEQSYRIEKSDSKVHWDEFVLEQGGHPLQLWGWGDLKAVYNWEVERFFIVEDDATIGAVQLLIRKLPKPFGQLLYVPRGPVIVGNAAPAVYNQLVAYAERSHKAIALSVEPDSELPPTGEGWLKSANTILSPHTLILDLTRPEGSLLADMSKKTRQYIRKSATDGLVVKKIGNPDDITDCLAIYKETAARANFNLHKDQYYYDLHNKLGENSVIFGCYDDKQLVAFLWLVVSEAVAFELYGGVNARGQELRANYTLKWEAIRRIKQWGVERYDLNGLINDGISTFKSGFAAHENELAGTYDLPMSWMYPLWSKVLPGGKRLVQRLRRQR